jgi:hypothetical protein
MTTESAISGGDDGRELRELMAQFDAPAYVRRARAVEGAYDQLLARCRRHRSETISMVRVRLGHVVALAGRWEVLAPLLADDAGLQALQELHHELRPALRFKPDPTMSVRALRRATGALCDSLRRFNERWQRFLEALDLAPINALREGYNRNYLLEKECAMRSARLARMGFRPLPPLTRDELATLFPTLPVPRLAGEPR